MPDPQAKAPARPRFETRTIEIMLPSKRPAALAVPDDMSDSDWLALVGMIPNIRDQLRKARAAELRKPDPLVVVKGNLPPLRES